MTRKAKTDICPICRGAKMYWIMVYDGGRAGNVLKPIGCSVCGGMGAISLALVALGSGAVLEEKDVPPQMTDPMLQDIKDAPLEMTDPMWHDKEKKDHLEAKWIDFDAGAPCTHCGKKGSIQGSGLCFLCSNDTITKNSKPGPK